MGIGYDVLNDDYPFESHIRNQPPPFMSDDVSNSVYVLKNQRVVQFVRPVVTRQVYVNGKPVKEERIVGDYEPAYNYDYGNNHNNALKENLDNLGIINGFLGQVQMEASMSPRDGAATFSPRCPAGAAVVENKPNWGSKAAWVAAVPDDSFSDYTEYPNQTQKLLRQLKDPSCGNYKSTWPNKGQASPSRSMVYSRQSMVESDTMSNGHNSPTGYGERFEAQNLYRSDSELNNPNWGGRPNWPNNRRASPPGSPGFPKRSTLNSDGTKPNRVFQDNSPTRYGDRLEATRPTHQSEEEAGQRQDAPPLKELERLDIKDNNQGGSSPNENIMDAYMARSSGSNVMKHGPDHDAPPKQSCTELVKNGNSDSLVKDNALQVKEPDRSPNWPNRKGQDQEKYPSYDSEGKKMEKHEPSNLDDGYYSKKESSNAMTSNDPISPVTRPKFYGGWYKPSQGTRGGGSSSTTTTKHWSEITPNPPPELTKHSVVESGEAMRRYAYMKPAMPTRYFDSATGYYGAITSEDAVKKYGGFFVPPS